jgi:hypothetical protein
MKIPRTHCGKGHEFTEKNTQIWMGKRYCRTCNAARELKRRRTKADGPVRCLNTKCRHSKGWHRQGIGACLECACLGYVGAPNPTILGEAGSVVSGSSVSE